LAEAKKEIIGPTPAWEGAQRLGIVLDRMTEGAVLGRAVLVAELSACGANGEKVVSGMLESGLFETVKVEGKVVLRLTKTGSAVIIHSMIMSFA